MTHTIFYVMRSGRKIRLLTDSMDDAADTVNILVKSGVVKVGSKNLPMAVVVPGTLPAHAYDFSAQNPLHP